MSIPDDVYDYDSLDSDERFYQDIENDYLNTPYASKNFNKFPRTSVDRNLDFDPLSNGQAKNNRMNKLRDLRSRNNSYKIVDVDKRLDAKNLSMYYDLYAYYHFTLMDRNNEEINIEAGISSDDNSFSYGPDLLIYSGFALPKDENDKTKILDLIKNYIKNDFEDAYSMKIRIYNNALLPD